MSDLWVTQGALSKILTFALLERKNALTIQGTGKDVVRLNSMAECWRQCAPQASHSPIVQVDSGQIDSLKKESQA